MEIRKHNGIRTMLGVATALLSAVSASRASASLDICASPTVPLADTVGVLAASLSVDGDARPEAVTLGAVALLTQVLTTMVSREKSLGASLSASAAPRSRPTTPAAFRPATPSSPSRSMRSTGAGSLAESRSLMSLGGAPVSVAAPQAELLATVRALRRACACMLHLGTFGTAGGCVSGPARCC
jgi:hypothetical protein